MADSTAEIHLISNLEELQDLFERSSQAPVWLFKHSLTCPISDAAWSEFKRFAEGPAEDGSAEFAVIEIQKARPVSAAVAERTQVRHASPQALLLSGGRAIWTGSHWDITTAALTSAHESAPEPSSSA